MKNKSFQIIQLRAHHLLCLQGYQGYGYDEKFKENLEKILTSLKNDKNIQITLTDSKDDICNCCPHLNNEKCISGLDLEKTPANYEKISESNNKIVEMDSKILNKANLEKNKKYSYKELINKINDVFSTYFKAKEICNDCEWENECLWLISKKKN